MGVIKLIEISRDNVVHLLDRLGVRDITTSLLCDAVQINSMELWIVIFGLDVFLYVFQNLMVKITFATQILSVRGYSSENQNKKRDQYRMRKYSFDHCGKYRECVGSPIL